MPAVRLGNVVASLSHAMDLTEGQAPGHSVRSCAIGMAIADELGMDGADRSALYYALLLKDSGCSANAAPVADAFGSDDQPVKKAMKTSEWTRYLSAVAYVSKNVGLGRGAWAKARHFSVMARGGSELARDFTRIRCERGAEIASDLGFDRRTAEAIRALDEHWDGNGHPYGLRGRAIPLGARIAGLAQTTEVFLHEFGVEEALTMIRERSGSWFDPELAEVVLSWHDRPAWWQQVRGMSGAVGIQGAEPEDRILRVDADGLDRVAEAFADVIDAKSPYTSDHSRGVADIARRLGRTLGLEREAGRRLYRAGLLHDIGKLGVSNRILDKPGKLTDQEFNAIRQHPVYSREILGPIEAFADVLQPACLHHERLDGTGYPWGFTGDRLTLECRILAGADVFEALSAKRPYRDSLTLDEVRDLMMRDAGHALDGDVLDALFDSSASGRCAQAPAHAMVGSASH